MSWNRRLMLAEAVKDGEMELDYLTIIPEGGNVTMVFNTWGYIGDNGSWVYAELLGSPDGGVNWYNIPDGQSITIPQGNKLLLKANYYDFIMENSSKFGNNYNVAMIDSLEGQFSVEGTPLSLAHGDDFKTRRELAPGMFMSLFNAYSAPEPGLIRIKNPESFLPSTELAKGCYGYMFAGCSELKNAPILSATSLAQHCYASMFSGCESLVEAPELPATELVEGCYEYMFGECGNLNYIEAMFTTRPSPTYTYNWVYRVSSTGTFVMSKDADWYVLGDYGIPVDWTVQTK